VELTADLDNVYYDLSHEFRTDCCGAQPTDWRKAKRFFEAAAAAIRARYAELQPGKSPLIGLDAEHFAKAGQRDWNFSNESFDLMILGNSTASPVPSVETVIAWREKHRKPFLLQEGGADDDRGGKIFVSYHDTHPTVVRKYVWKWMMAKNQLIGIYQKSHGDGYPDNYNPFGHSRFQEDAKVLRAFWNTLTDYGNLDYIGRIISAPCQRNMVLSSKQEVIAYLASEMGRIGIEYPAQLLIITDLALSDGTYTVAIWKPAAPGGLVRKIDGFVKDGRVAIRLPAFTDDLAIHICRASRRLPQTR
jgi:hypothetical protein